MLTGHWAGSNHTNYMVLFLSPETQLAESSERPRLSVRRIGGKQGRRFKKTLIFSFQENFNIFLSESRRLCPRHHHS